MNAYTLTQNIAKLCPFFYVRYCQAYPAPWHHYHLIHYQLGHRHNSLQLMGKLKVAL